MPEPRWTDQTRDVVAHQLHRLLCIERDWDRCNLHGQHWGDARAILAALADAGLLLPPGGETRVAWTVQTAGVSWPGYESEADAWGQVAAVKQWPSKPRVQVFRQEITEWPDGRRYYAPLVEVQP